MGDKKHKNFTQYQDDIDVFELARAFVWGSSPESKREAASVYVIHAIAKKYHGKAEVDLASHSIDIQVPDEQKAACLKEIEEKTGMVFH